MSDVLGKVMHAFLLNSTALGAHNAPGAALIAKHFATLNR